MWCSYRGRPAAFHTWPGTAAGRRPRAACPGLPAPRAAVSRRARPTASAASRRRGGARWRRPCPPCVWAAACPWAAGPSSAGGCRRSRARALRTSSPGGERTCGPLVPFCVRAMLLPAVPYRHTRPEIGTPQPRVRRQWRMTDASASRCRRPDPGPCPGRLAVSAVRRRRPPSAPRRGRRGGRWRCCSCPRGRRTRRAGPR